MRCRQARLSVSLAQDGRLKPAGAGRLQAHLDRCPSCRQWQQEQVWLRGLLRRLEAPPAGSGFQEALMARVASGAAHRNWPALPPVTLLRPALLRAAAVLAWVVSALLGFAIGGRLDKPSPATVAAAFDRTLNLDAFADLPGGSFGAVHEELLREDAR